MIEEITAIQFKIPKTVAPVVLHTTAGESVAGDIFLDVMGKWALQHLHDFFEADSLFIPIRTPETEKPILIARKILALVELISFSTLLQSDTSIMLSKKKAVMLDVQGLPPFNCEILIDTPADRSRILDVLNRSGHFLSIVWNNTYSLVNKSHISRAVEL